MARGGARVTSRLHARTSAQTSSRLDEKQGRAFEGARGVRVLGAGGYFIATLNSLRDAEQIRRLLDAPNAQPVCSHRGDLKAIIVFSFGDDRGAPGERHGRSTITTERVRSDAGELIGSHCNLKHKTENVKHGLPEPRWALETGRRMALRPPLARKSDNV
jgi:hypothetical protein